MPLSGAASLMIDELETQRLRVVLVPSEYHAVALRGGKVRRVEEQNPAWYRMFCATYEANRTRLRNRAKPDTLIKRQGVLRALREIKDTGCAGTLYARRLLPWVEDYAAGHFFRIW